ncbi:MAG: addiction module protein [Phycisphaera sp.]|nr:addiction module protein [Phycisphaera sp.]
MDSKQILSEAMQLSPAERADLADRLWESVANELSDEQLAELDRRLEEYRANPGEGSDWDSVEARLLDKL